MSADTSSNTSPYGSDTQRYWDRRYELFSRFDNGIVVDREGLFSVKPEVIANQIAERLPGDVVLDAFCGVGGSSIAFARRKKRVVAVDIDPKRLSMAEHNAAVYGVSSKITFLTADVMHVFEQRGLFDAVYLDPSWGGPAYHLREKFTLDMFNPNGRQLMETVLKHGCPFAFTVPKNFEIRELSDYGEPFLLEWNELNGVRLFATAYFRLDSLHDHQA